MLVPATAQLLDLRDTCRFLAGKSLLSPILSCPIPQMDTLFILQGEAMDTSLGGLTLAAATVSVVESISSLFWVAAYDLVIAPFFASKGRPISSLLLRRSAWLKHIHSSGHPSTICLSQGISVHNLALRSTVSGLHLHQLV